MTRPTRPEFEQFVREHHAAVYRSALRITDSKEDAADVAQDVFVRLLRGKVRFAGAASVRAVLCWQATRLAANVHRSRRRRVHHEEAAMKDPERSVPDPLQATARADLLSRVTELVDSLPQELRLPLQLRCQDGLTFAAIGSALRVSESTAHVRFGRAVERLRGQLQRRGSALAATAVTGLVADVPAPSTPVALEGHLLELGRTGAAAGAGVARRVAVMVTAAAAVVVVAVASALESGVDPMTTTAASAPPATAAAAMTPQEPPPEREAVAPNRPGADGTPAVAPDDQEPVAAPAVIIGTVHDAGAWPVVGARVQAVASGGLKPFDLGATETDEQGAFRLELKPGIELGPGVSLPAGVAKLRVLENGALLHTTPDLAVPRPADAEPLHIVLPAALGTEMTRFVLAVTVTGADGTPLAGVPVALQSGAARKPLPGVGPKEAEAVTDALGTARLRGRIPGAKWLFVDGRAQGHTASFAPCSVQRPGEQRTAVRLAGGATLRGTVRAHDGGDLQHVTVWLEDEHGLTFPTKVAPDGSFAFAGLCQAAHTLHAGGWPWSRVRRAGIVPDGQPIAIELKQSDDPRDVGDHMAEIHGRLVDAVTGETVPFGGFAVETHPLRAGESSLATDAAERPKIAQRATDGQLRERFHETGLPPGRRVIVVEVPGYAVTVHVVDLAEGELIADLHIPLQRGAEVRGRIVDDRGEPVARARAFVLGVGPRADANLRACDEPERRALDPYDRLPGVTLCSALTREDGTFVLRDVPPGVPLRLAALADGCRVLAEAPTEFRPDQKVTGLVLRLGATFR